MMNSILIVLDVSFYLLHFDVFKRSLINITPPTFPIKKKLINHKIYLKKTIQLLFYSYVFTIKNCKKKSKNDTRIKDKKLPFPEISLCFLYTFELCF